MIAPRLAQGMCSKVTVQANLSANSGNELPGLSTFERLWIVVAFGCEKDEMLRVTDNIGINSQVVCQCFSDAVIDNHFVAFATLFLTQPETRPHPLLVIQKVTDAELEKVGDSQRRVNSDDKQ